MRPVVLPFYARTALVLISVMILGYLAILGQRILIPLLFSFLFAVLLLPLANLLESKARFSRTAAALTSVIIFVLVLSFLIYVLGAQLSGLFSDWPLLKSQLNLLFYNLQLYTINNLHIDAQKQLNYIQSASDKLMHSGTAIIGQTVLSLSSLLLFVVFLFIYTTFILLYRKLLVRFLTVAFTEKFAPLINEIAFEIKHVIRGYIVGLFLEMAIVSIVSIIIFLILGIKYAFLLGLIIGIFNIVPYVGIFSALLISVLVTFATTNPVHALYVAIAGILIHLTDSNFLMPRVVGSHVKINPLFVVLGVVTGEMIWGIPGMFLSIPYLAIIKVIFDRIEGLTAWGILLGEEEKMPAAAKPLQRWMKKGSPKK